ncbi:MAG: Holliday junction branch migration protein RuvA [Clostridiales bacterium]|nr:Holliday junction branch migration protein RuvA [Clostridiales bacterium]MBQ2769419.1 Holliday junction branch migration protein RuvA [Clostridia bacterium]
MISYLRGKVVTITPETAILDVNGVGYEAYCSGGAFQRLTVGAVAELYTYLQVKEDGVTLFGFASPKEKELFLKLITVSGVGPKMGISILASLSADDFAMAIATADVKRLSAVKGLGKKTAEKIILELHGKISAVEVLGASGDELTPAAESAPAKLSALDEEAVSALMGLGFTRSESVQAVKKAHDLGAKSVEEIIMKALQGGV